MTEAEPHVLWHARLAPNAEEASVWSATDGIVATTFGSDGLANQRAAIIAAVPQMHSLLTRCEGFLAQVVVNESGDVVRVADDILSALHSVLADIDSAMTICRAYSRPTKES